MVATPASCPSCRRTKFYLLMGNSISTVREDAKSADRETRLEIEERLNILEKAVRSHLDCEQLSIVAEDRGDKEICTGMVVDVLRKVNVVMSLTSKEIGPLIVEDVIKSFFSEVNLTGLDKLINSSISEIVANTKVGEHSLSHMIVLPTSISSLFLRCDAYYYRWNFASRGIINNLEGVIGVLLLKRVVDITKTDNKVLKSALLDTLNRTADDLQDHSESELGSETILEEESDSKTESSLDTDEEGLVVREKKREIRMVKRKTLRWKRRRAKYRRGRVGKRKTRRIFGPKKQRKMTRKNGRVYGGGL